MSNRLLKNQYPKSAKTMYTKYDGNSEGAMERRTNTKLKERVLQLSDECLAFITLDLCHLELPFSLLICAFHHQ